MPDIVIVPTAVLPGPGAQYMNGIAGAAINAGDVCTQDAANQRFVLADSSDVVLARVKGIAAHNAAVGQPLRLQTGGQLNLGSALLAVGVLYALSGTTPGKIAPVDELTTGDVVTVLGVGQTTSILLLRLWLTELALA